MSQTSVRPVMAQEFPGDFCTSDQPVTTRARSDSLNILPFRRRSESAVDAASSLPIMKRRDSMVLSLASPPMKRRGTLANSLDTLTSLSFMQSKNKTPAEAPITKERRSEGSLMVSISKKFIRKSGGILHKTSSLIDVKPPVLPLPKSGSSIQLGKPSKTGYFGLSLEETMALQQERFSDFEIPVILIKLTEDIMKYDGCRTEGIFRVAGSSQLVTKLQLHYNNMNFDEYSSDPHVLVGVLKQWLRELKDPLIPNTLYQECVECEAVEDCLKTIDKLPILNKECFGHLVRFLRIIAKPENHEYTKMDVSNLCVVFAPVMFRCPTTDMAELIVSMQKERLFMAHVLESSAYCEPQRNLE